MKTNVFVLALLLCAAALCATTYQVPGDFTTIQAALNACVYGDSVEVSPGVYYGGIGWPAVDGITLSGDDPTNTIIDAQQNGRALTFPGSWQNSYITPATKVRNVTIRNGYGPNNGSGVYCNYASPGISDCIIAFNSAPTWSMSSGGGIYFYASNAILNNVYIVKNQAYSGAGVHIDPSSSPTFTDCVFADNTLFSPGGSYAAGIYMRYQTNPSFTRCIVTRNRSFGSAAIHLGEVSSPSFAYCSITDNDYGFRLVSDATLSMSQTTISGNTEAGFVNAGSQTPNIPENWWGSNSGPEHTGNPNGNGDLIQGNAIYSPWNNQPSNAAAPPPPRDVVAEWTPGSTGGEITVNWDPCPEDEAIWWVYWGLDSLSVVHPNYQMVTTNSAVINALQPFAWHYVQVRVVRSNGTSSWFSETVPVYVGSTDAEDPQQTPAPRKVTVSPNPFRECARIAYTLEKSGVAELTVYNLRGQVIRRIEGQGSTLNSGVIVWDGRGENGEQMPAGVYIVRVSNGRDSASSRVLLTR